MSTTSFGTPPNAENEQPETEKDRKAREKREAKEREDAEQRLAQEAEEQRLAREQEHARTALTAVPVANTSPSLQAAATGKKIFVDETVERSVQVRYSTVTFRPNEELKPERDKLKIALAEAHGISLRYK